MAKYEVGGKEYNWLKYKQVNGRNLLGCDLCQRYKSAGYPLHGRQAIGRFEFDFTNKNNHVLDGVVQHCRRQGGDHNKALEHFRSTLCDLIAPSPESKAPSSTVRACVDHKDENQIAYAYTCHKLGLTAAQFKVLSDLSYRLGADLPEHYTSARFFKEVADAASACLHEQLLANLQGSPVVTINVDEGILNTNAMVVRVHYLDAAWEPKTAFWQCTFPGRKDHEALCRAVLQSLTEGKVGLSRAALAQKLVSICTDGAAVMGVQRQSRPLDTPVEGPKGNLAASLQQFKSSHTKDTHVLTHMILFVFSMMLAIRHYRAYPNHRHIYNGCIPPTWPSLETVTYTSLSYMCLSGRNAWCAYGAQHTKSILSPRPTRIATRWAQSWGFCDDWSTMSNLRVGRRQHYKAYMLLSARMRRVAPRRWTLCRKDSSATMPAQRRLWSLSGPYVLTCIHLHKVRRIHRMRGHVQCQWTLASWNHGWF